MAHLGDEYEDRLVRGFDEAQALAHADPVIRKLVAQRKADNEQIIKALEIAGKEIAALKKAKAAPARPAASAPARIPAHIEALSEKLRAQSIADSRARG